MKKWQKRFMAIVSALGFTEQLRAGNLTADEQRQIFSNYQEKYGTAFEDDRAANEDDEEPQTTHQATLSPEEQQQLASVLGVSQDDVVTTQDAIVRITQLVQQQNETISQLASLPETVTQQTVQGATFNTEVRNRMLGVTPHTSDHLFGISEPLYKRGPWFNELVVTRKLHNDHISTAERNDFISAFTTFSTSFNQRVEELNSNNAFEKLNYEQLTAGEGTIDYTNLTNTAGEYTIRRTDLIIAYLRTLPGVSNIFPIVSHVQNKEIAPSASFGELSQGYRKGRIFKGNVRFAAEIYNVEDLMFKFNFEDLIDLEKMYIGYLNREGAAVIKWTFIEWIMVHFGTILHNEQQRRRVMGVNVPEQDVIANPAMFGADGILRAIERVEEQRKVQPFTDLTTYDANSIVDVFEEMWDRFTQLVDNTDGYRIYANAKHRQWYIRQFRAKYGEQTDFTGASGTPMIDLAPSSIIWVPNMPTNCFKIWITLPGNIETYEDRPSEMNSFEFVRDYESILALSRWKEGAGLLAAGVQYQTDEELKAAEFSSQWIFTNNPISDLELAEQISFKENNLFSFSGNTTVATVTGYSTERVYKLVAQATGNKIPASGAFEKLNTDFIAVAPGDYIKVYAELKDENKVIDGKTIKVTVPTGKFLELERRVTAQ